MNTDRVYIVLYETGEFSDRAEQPIIAFFREESAQAYVEKATRWLRDHNLSYDSPTMPDWEECERLIKNCPFGVTDIQYTGGRFSYFAVALGSEDAQGGGR